MDSQDKHAKMLTALAQQQAAQIEEFGIATNRRINAAMKESMELHEKFADTWKCKICKDSFVNAVNTPCGHGFCMTCLSRWREAHREVMGPSGAASNNSDVAAGGAFGGEAHQDNNAVTPCPVCRRDASFIRAHIGE